MIDTSRAGCYAGQVEILVVKSSSLGDIVHALPAVRAFQAAHPEAAIDWLVESAWAPILQGHPLIRRLISFDSHSVRDSLLSPALYRDFIKSIATLRRVRYDAVVDLQRLTKSAGLLYLLRARRRAGFSITSCRERLAVLPIKDKARIDYQGDPVREQYLAPFQLLTGRPLTLPEPPHLSVSPEAEASVREKLGHSLEEPFAVALLGAGFSTKVWPVEHWLSLLERLAAVRPVLLPWADRAEREAAERAAERIENVHLAPAMNLRELAAFLAQARLVVGGDTGPLHLAAALGVQTVSFYGPTRRRRNAPPGHPAIQSPVECTGCVKRKCPKENFECLEAITPDMVWQAMEPVLEGS